MEYDLDYFKSIYGDDVVDEDVEDLLTQERYKYLYKALSALEPVEREACYAIFLFDVGSFPFDTVSYRHGVTRDELFSVARGALPKLRNILAHSSLFSNYAGVTDNLVQANRLDLLKRIFMDEVGDAQVTE